MDNEGKIISEHGNIVRIDKASIEQWLGTDNQLFEATDIFKDIYNGDYTVQAFRQDIMEYFEPDDRGDINR